MANLLEIRTLIGELAGLLCSFGSPHMDAHINNKSILQVSVDEVLDCVLMQHDTEFFLHELQRLRLCR